MICNNCKTKFPPSHTICPSCGNKDFSKEEKAPVQVIKEETEEVEKISPYAVDGDINDICAY